MSDATTSAVPRLSVVVPTCGRPQLLRRCLQALMAQDLAPAAFEIVIVVDGPEGSADDATLALAQALAAERPQHALRCLHTGQRRGPAAARNLGWRAARGALVAFTDDDTVPAPDWLSRGEDAMRHGLWAALGGRVRVPPLDEPPTDHEQMTRGLERTEFVTANAFVRRRALQRVRGFDERFTRAWREDSDLQFRLQDKAGPVGRCEQAVVLHPVRPERWGVSLRQQKNAFFEALLFAKHPRRYRDRLAGAPPWDYYAIVLLALATLVSTATGRRDTAFASAALAVALVARFAWRRLRNTSHRPGHVVQMALTSLLIPFLSVYWRLRGAWHFRVWFL